MLYMVVKYSLLLSGNAYSVLNKVNLKCETSNLGQ
jgi:hypothetical protein